MTESELINGCKRYNKEAQRELYLTYAPKLKCVCQRYADAHYAADDLLQEGFIKIFSNIKQFKCEGSFEGWMRRIIVNTAISYFRKKNKDPKFEDLAPNGAAALSDHEDKEETIFEMLQEKLSKEDVFDEMNRLPETFRLVLNLYIFENFSHKEISDSLSISVQNSKVRLMRARQMLQASLLDLLKCRYPESASIVSLKHEFNFQKAI